jgi:guanylate kinase
MTAVKQLKLPLKVAKKDLPKAVISLTGPTASGKDTMLKYLETNYPIKRLLSDVTRARREGEVDGIDYNFISREQFEENLKKGEYFQHVSFRGNLYGTNSKEVKKTLDTGKVPILILEPSGIPHLDILQDEYQLKPIKVFVSAPLEDLLARYFKRTSKEEFLKNPEYGYERLKGMIVEYEMWERMFQWDVRIQNDSYVDYAIEEGAFRIANKLGLLNEYKVPGKMWTEHQFFKEVYHYGHEDRAAKS